MSTQHILLILLVSCLSLCFMGCGASKHIQPQGLTYISIGDPLPAKGLKKYKRHAVTDTLYDQGGYKWQGRILDYKHGEVIVEEDFFGEGRVNRIRVESPDLIFEEKIRVGATLMELWPMAADWTASYLTDYKLIDIFSRKYPNTHFLITVSPEDQELIDKDFIPVFELQPGNHIVSIIIQ